jgi:hypothetical protein
VRVGAGGSTRSAPRRLILHNGAFDVSAAGECCRHLRPIIGQPAEACSARRHRRNVGRTPSGRRLPRARRVPARPGGVQGAQPIEAKPFACSGLRGTARASAKLDTASRAQSKSERNSRRPRRGVGSDEDDLATMGRLTVEPSPRANGSETALLARYPAMLLVPASRASHPN